MVLGFKYYERTINQNMSNTSSTYKVEKLLGPLEVDANWNKAHWRNIKAFSINQHMGADPTHRPKVASKIVFDEKALYIIFNAEDRFVKAVAQNYQDKVYKDSCVEFFFSPSDKLGMSYFNLEINCGGTAIFCWHPENKIEVPVSDEDFQQIKIAHSLSKVIDPEIQSPITWSVEYRLPFDLIKKYCPETMLPSKGAIWKANFYKCADDSSHPHWLTWSFVDHPQPQFHLPQHFGNLIFE